MSLSLPSAPASIRFAGPADLVSGVPLLLGFVPGRSVVVVAMSGGVVALTARVDLPSPDCARDAPAVARSLTGPLRRVGADSAVLVLYPDDPAEGGASGAEDDDPVLRAVTVAVRESLTAVSVRVLDVLVVSGGRWRSLECSDPTCCPPGGQVVPEPGVGVRAAFALAGRAPLSSRAAIGELVAPAGATARRRCALAVDRRTRAAVAVIERSGLDAWRRQAYRDAAAALDAPGPQRQAEVSDGPAAAVVAVAARDIRVRDALLARLARCTDRDRRQRLLASLCVAVRQAPAGWVAPVASLAAAAAHLLGDGALAHAALDRADGDEPDYSLARLLRDGLAAGLPPAEVEHALGVFRPEQLLADDLPVASVDVSGLPVDTDDEDLADDAVDADAGSDDLAAVAEDAAAEAERQAGDEESGPR